MPGRARGLGAAPGPRSAGARLGLDPATAASETTREPLRFHALQLADESLRDALPEKLWAQVRERSAALRASPAPALPTGLVADLRPYQKEGFHFLAFLSENNFGGVLADDMGLGKTLQTLAWLLHLSALKPKRPTSSRASAAKSFRVLVVCPKSVMVNWQLETARFAPSLTTTAFTSALLTPKPETPNPKPSARSSGSPLSALGTHLLIANYAQLRLYADAFAAERETAEKLLAGRARIEAELAKVIVGQREVIEQIMPEPEEPKPEVVPIKKTAAKKLAVKRAAS